MNFTSKNDLKIYQSDLLNQEKGLWHGFFTRLGGVSQGPFTSLNLGGSVGDTDENVIENRRRIFDFIQRPVDSLFDAWQVHGTDHIVVTRPRGSGFPFQKADIILTDRREITLMMRFADCVPIILYDPVKKAAGLVHAGWQGTVKKAVQFAVKAMAEAFSCSPENMHACIGPSICVDHYEVGYDVIEAVEKKFDRSCLDEILVRKEGKTRFNLWKANQLSLQEAGVDRIEVMGICTAGHTDEWFSHRGEGGKTGRFAAAVYMN